MIAIVDYGVGNLFSVKSSFAAIGAEAVVTSDPAVIDAADHILLPGVGAYEDAARKLRETGMGDVVRRQAAAGKPIMGICLGMQLLFDVSYEYGEHQGLGLIPGAVTPLGVLNDAEHKVKVYLDKDFLNEPKRIGVHPNDNTATVWLNTEDLMEIIQSHGTELECVEL